MDWKRVWQKGKLIFYGEYLNNQKWKGNINEYYDDGKIKSQKKLFNGVFNGKDKEYYYIGKLLYEFEYLNGIKIGNLR